MFARRTVVFVLLAAIAAAQEKKTAEDMRSYLRSCAHFGFSGSVLVAHGGKVILAEGFGLADREKKVACTKETLFEIASATKPFTAVAILQLEADGKLSCDDPIGKHLPGVPSGFEDVTIHHLLTHTSGIPRSPSGTGDDLATAVATYLSGKRKQAGVAYEYSNGGYALLAGIVERKSGGTYMDFCRRRIFEPAGMKSSGFTGDTHFDAGRIAIGYEGGKARSRRADEHPYKSYGWQYRGMGGLVTTVEDFFLFDRALRNDTLLPEAARKKLFTPILEGYACGFRVTSQPRRTTGHGGSVRGFHCQFTRYPDDDACIVVLANCGGIPIPAIEDHLKSLVFGGPSTAPKLPATVAWPQAKLDALAGVYEASPGERLVVACHEGGAIVLGAEGPDAVTRIGPSSATPLRPAPHALVEAAQTMVRKLADGNVEPVRQRIASGIPATWPDRLKTEYWPERAGKLGKLESVRATCAISDGTTATVLFALGFEKGVLNVKVGFVGDRLQIFDLHAPEFLAEARVQPASDTRLVRFAWSGADQPTPITIVRDGSGRPSGFRFEGSGTNPVYKRVMVK